MEAVGATRTSTPTTSKISTETLEKAVTALLQWKSSKSETQKPQLLSSDEFLYLVLTLNKIPPKGRTNAYKIPVPNPLYSSDDSELCLFLDDNRISSKSAKAKILEEQIPVSKVIKFSKLKTDYKPFESKRKLCDSYDMFFADRRIIPLLPKAIGRHFFKKKKIPMPVELGHKNWKEQIERACSSALLYLSTGTCSVVKVAKVSMSKDEILENLGAVVDGIAEFLPKKWGNVRSLHLKFSGSVALPIYQAVPEMRMKISTGLAVRDDENVESDMGKESDKENKKVGKKKKKGRIHEVRYMDSVKFGTMVGGDESGSDNEEGIEDGEMGSAENSEIVCKKRKNGDVKKEKKDQIKKKEVKLKKEDKGLKQKKGNTEKKSKRSKVAV